MFQHRISPVPKGEKFNEPVAFSLFFLPFSLSPFLKSFSFRQIRAYIPFFQFNSQHLVSLIMLVIVSASAALYLCHPFLRWPAREGADSWVQTQIHTYINNTAEIAMIRVLFKFNKSYTEHQSLVPSQLTYLPRITKYVL